MTKNILCKKKYWLIAAILPLVIFAYWFFNKFYPAQVGEWSQESQNNFDEKIVFDSGWEEKSFWTSLDFPGKQNVCLDISPRSGSTKIQTSKITVTQAPRAYFYPKAGTIQDLFIQMDPAHVEEKIKQNKPFFIGHLGSRVQKEGKDLFFLGENEKFLIPTKSIFSKHFPTKKVPETILASSALPYANILINLPEGVLLSDGKGVFVTSQGQLFLIRSPEVFEAMGYKWENIVPMDNYQKSFSAFLSGNLINFDSANPNGTIVKIDQTFYLIWESKLYFLTPDEVTEFFSHQPQVEITHKELQGICSEKNGSKINCCVSDVDTRLNPPNVSPFLNTLGWNINQISDKNQIVEIDWQSKIAVNNENTLKRIVSLKNFVLYGLGILK